jgi:predicted glycoside hydrolase/deacetylase ChbG (UPF0249 family)
LTAERFLIVLADDFGIGLPTSQGILDLAVRGLVTGSVLLVNSPYAEQSVQAWRKSGSPLELGWHPCLTLDRPLLPPHQVPSLVCADGSFYPLRPFLCRLFLGLLRSSEIAIELKAQYLRFRELVGAWPAFVNGQHHAHVFAPVHAVLAELLSRQNPLPYVRRMRESWRVLLHVPGARIKRVFLSAIGRAATRRFDRAGFPGNDSLAGVTDPVWVRDGQYLARWLSCIPGRVVELAVHPGYLDQSLIGRDCTEHDGCLQRRVDELHLLSQPSFLDLCRQAGFRLISPSQLLDARQGASERAA